MLPLGYPSVRTLHVSFILTHAVKQRTEYLQERLNLELSQPTFSVLPFRFTEIAKVILDVSVLVSIPLRTTLIQSIQSIRWPRKPWQDSFSSERSTRSPSGQKSRRFENSGSQRTECKALNYSTNHSDFLCSCRTYAPWKLTKFDHTLSNPWAFWHSLPVTHYAKRRNTLRPILYHLFKENVYIILYNSMIPVHTKMASVSTNLEISHMCFIWSTCPRFDQ